MAKLTIENRSKPLRLVKPKVNRIIQEELAAEDTAYGDAQELCYDAFELTSPKMKIELALSALSIHPKCSDAWFLLGTYAKEGMEKLGFFRNGIYSAIEYFGEELDLLPLWSAIETRPFMRCRFAFAETLWQLGFKKEAISEGWELLSDNPSDNQGMRYLLIGWLLAHSDLKNASKLIEQYSGDYSLEWGISKIVLHIKLKTAGSEQLKKAYRDLCNRNKHLAKFLQVKAKVPKTCPDWIEVGGESEVVSALQHLSDFFKVDRAVWMELQAINAFSV